MKQDSAKQICADGVALLEAGRTDAALSRFTEGLSVTKDPYERGTLYYNIAVCHARLHRNADAIAALADTVKAYPRHLRTIRRGTDFPELVGSPEFTSFLKAASANASTRFHWAIGYAIVWIVVLIIWNECRDGLRRTNPNLPGIALIVLAAAFGGMIDIFRRLKRRQDTQANESLTWSITNAVNPTGQNSPDLVCPKCGRPYNLADYRKDAGHIFCSYCNAELPRRIG